MALSFNFMNPILKRSNLGPIHGKLPKALTLALAVLYVLAQANPLASLPCLDSGNYLYGARQLLQEKLLYVDVWNHKTFGIGLGLVSLP